MSKLKWDQNGERQYETGTDHGVLYIPSIDTGEYDQGFPWNGLTAVTDSPSGAEASKQYADNRVYANLVSAEEWGGTIEAFTYPDEFEQCDGSMEMSAGVSVGQQGRRSFGFSWRTKIGNDLLGQDAGYKIHIVYGALASPSEKSYATINESPELITFSWELTTTPVEVPIEGFKPTAKITINSLKADPTALAELEEILYGKDAVVTPVAAPAVDPRLPLPEELAALFPELVP